MKLGLLVASENVHKHTDTQDSCFINIICNILISLLWNGSNVLHLKFNTISNTKQIPNWKENNCSSFWQRSDESQNIDSTVEWKLQDFTSTYFYDNDQPPDSRKALNGLPKLLIPLGNVVKWMQNEEAKNGFKYMSISVMTSSLMLFWKCEAW